MTTKHILAAQCYNKNGKLLSSATNSYKKTHPLQKMFACKAGFPAKQYLHAEISAIIKAKGQTIHALHVSRFNKQGKMMNAKPCPVCCRAIREYGIMNVFYTSNNGCIEQLDVSE